MSTVLVDGLAMVKNLLVGQVGTNGRWTDDTVQTLLVAADREVRERCGIHFHQQEITLASDTYSYDLDPEFVSIDLVEFSHDGTNYDWRPTPIGLNALDCVATKWRTLRSGRADYYTVLSAPGVQAVGSTKPSQVMIYPCPAVATAEKIRVTGVAVVGTADMATATASVEVLGRCHVPHVLSVLYSSESPERSIEEYRNFEFGCVNMRTRFISQYGNNPSRGMQPW